MRETGRVVFCFVLVVEGVKRLACGSQKKKEGYLFDDFACFVFLVFLSRFWLLGVSASWLFGLGAFWLSASWLLGFWVSCWFMRLLVAFLALAFASSAFPVNLRQVAFWLFGFCSFSLAFAAFGGCFLALAFRISGRWLFGFCTLPASSASPVPLRQVLFVCMFMHVI